MAGPQFRAPVFKMPGMSNGQMPNKLLNITQNPVSFHDLLNNHGIRMVHLRPVPCPNILSVDAPSTHVVDCSHCENGYIYFGRTEFIGAPAGMSMDRRFGQNGAWDSTNASIIVPTRDLKDVELDVQYFDRIEIPDFSVRYYERLHYNQSGRNTLRFRPVSVEYVIDARGEIYVPGIDIDVDGRKITWLTNRRPGYNTQIDKGVVFSVSYYTKPTFTVVGLPHQLRMAQTKAKDGGNNLQARFPQLAIVRREFLPEPEPRDET